MKRSAKKREGSGGVKEDEERTAPAVTPRREGSVGDREREKKKVFSFCCSSGFVFGGEGRSLSSPVIPDYCQLHRLSLYFLNLMGCARVVVVVGEGAHAPSISPTQHAQVCTSFGYLVLAEKEPFPPPTASVCGCARHAPFWSLGGGGWGRGRADTTSSTRTQNVKGQRKIYIKKE